MSVSLIAITSISPSWRHRFTPLDITTEHALAVENLPPHHADPFDRMLVAQAQVEKLTLVTRDERLFEYAVPAIEALTHGLSRQPPFDMAGLSL